VKNELMADDLISETYLKITNWDAIPEKDEEFIKVFVTQMKWEFKGKRSKFNKLYNGKDVVSHLNKSMAENYVNLVVFKESLPGWDKEIFHQYFELGMSSRDIAKGLTDLVGYESNYQNINKLINEVKTKIEQWKSQSQ